MYMQQRYLLFTTSAPALSTTIVVNSKIAIGCVHAKYGTSKQNGDENSYILYGMMTRKLQLSGTPGPKSTHRATLSGSHNYSRVTYTLVFVVLT